MHGHRVAAGPSPFEARLRRAPQGDGAKARTVLRKGIVRSSRALQVASSVTHASGRNAALGRMIMPERRTVEKARKARRAGKAPSSQAGEFVHEEIRKIRRGEHGAKSARQAVAIGLSKARRAGVPLRPPKKGTVKARTRKSAEYAYEAGQGRRKTRRRPRVARALSRVLKRLPRRAASSAALSRQTRRAAARRSAAARAAAARKAVRTKGAAGRSAAAKKAARTRARRGR